MNILIISDCYYPENKSISRHIYDLIKVLSSNNIKIEFYFISSVRNKNFFKKKFINKNIKYYPVDVDEIKNKNFLIRGIKEFIMPFLIWKKLKKNQLQFAKVFVFSPSIFFGLIFKRIKYKFKCKIILIIRDIFPDWALQKNKFLWLNIFYIFAKFISKLQFLHCDVIATQSLFDKNKLKKIYPNKEITAIYNWITPKKMNFKKRKNKITNFIFGGTIGPAQNWTNIINLIKQLIDEKQKFNFYFVGNGKYKNYLINKLSIYKNIFFIKALSEQKFLHFLTKMDIGIISLHKNIKYNNIPGKFFSYMECNIPVLLDADFEQEISKIINKYNLGLANTNNKNLLYTNSIKFIKDNINYSELRKNYQRLLTDKFSTQIAFKKLIKL